MTISTWPRPVFEEFNDEQIAWLQKCFERILAGEELKPDPFYERTSLLPPEKVDEILKVIDDKYEVEISAGYIFHFDAYQIPTARMSDDERKRELRRIMRPPRFLKLPPSQKLAIVQGMDKIVMKYRKIAAEKLAEEAAKTPSPTSYEDMYTFYC